MLFKTTDLNVAGSKNLEVFSSKNHTLSTILQSPKSLKTDLGVLQDGFCYDFVTNGTISVIHLITYCLEQIGKADLFFATWSIGETACRNLISLKENALIGSIEGVFSSRVNTNSSAAYTMLKQHCNRYATAELHAKVYILLSEHIGIVIKGSLNIGDNPKIEAGNIIVNYENALFHKNWISQIIEKRVMKYE